jgi:mannose-1-phosphate guanylyltransferase
MAENYSGRIVVDDATCTDVHIINETGLPLVVAGMESSVVIATPDGILVSGKEESANIKEQIVLAAESRPMYEQRCWGEYRVLDSMTFPDKNKVLTKELIIKAGQQLSYQRHRHRTEVWTIVYGAGEVVLDGTVQPVSSGAVIIIEKQKMHALRAFSELHIIEVQLGDELTEEDIERFNNYWN